MDAKISLHDYNRRFRYTDDLTVHNKKDKWVVMDPGVDNLFRGDCEDYVLTLRAKVRGFGKTKIYYCYTDGRAHMVGSVNGKLIDSSSRKLVNSERFIRKFRITNLTKIDEDIISQRVNQFRNRGPIVQALLDFWEHFSE